MHDPAPGTLGWFVAAAEREAAPLSAVFLRHEEEQVGTPRPQVTATLAARLEVMRQARARGLGAAQRSRSGLIDGDAFRLATFAAAGGALLAPALTRVAAAAIAVGEVNACMGRVVAAPTAGSCGVLPAALLGVAEARGLDDAVTVRGLVVAGGVGTVIERFASLSGAAGGCQAEIGSASAMAAGALVEMAGGAPAAVDHAVAFALANVLGLICDPVGGFVEVPCVKRNVLGALNAVACAEMALAGCVSAFPADEVIVTMGRVGRRLPEELRETARGGLALLTPRPGR